MALTKKQRAENAKRRERAREITAQYAFNTGDQDSLTDCVTDMIADLRHLLGHGKSIERAGEDFGDILRRASQHFEAERNGED